MTAFALYDGALIRNKTMERTCVMIKPEGVLRGLVGSLIQRFENRGLQLVALRMRPPRRDLIEQHFKELPFHDKLTAHLVSGPVVCMCYQGHRAVEAARAILGTSDPGVAALGMFRADLALAPGRNIVHGADFSRAAIGEMSLWFDEGDMCDWTQVIHGLHG